MPEVVLRPAEEEDIAEMLALYAPYVIQTTVSSEYDAPSIGGVYPPVAHLYPKAAVAGLPH